MPLLSEYQTGILKNLRHNNLSNTITKMKGKCHDAIIGEWINWWLSKNLDRMILNPARGSKIGSTRFIADLHFLERFVGSEYFEVKGVAEIENNEEAMDSKIKSLASYEKCSKRGEKVYPELEFSILSYRIALPNDELRNNIYTKIEKVSESSDLLWIVCELGSSLNGKKRPDYLIHMPNHIKGYDSYWYNRDINMLTFYALKKGTQLDKSYVPGFTYYEEFNSR